MTDLSHVVEKAKLEWRKQLQLMAEEEAARTDKMQHQAENHLLYSLEQIGVKSSSESIVFEGDAEGDRVTASVLVPISDGVTIEFSQTNDIRERMFIVERDAVGAISKTYGYITCLADFGRYLSGSMTPFWEAKKTETDNEKSVVDVAASRAYSVFLDYVADEVQRAETKFPPLNSCHEAYAVILEELEEFWDMVKQKSSDRDPVDMERELIQTAAMCARAAVNLGLTTTGSVMEGAWKR